MPKLLNYALAITSFICIATAGSQVLAQVKKCVGPDGKVTYSDSLCISSTASQGDVKVNANTIDASGLRQEAQKTRADAAVADAMKQDSPQCKFAASVADAKGKALAASAKEECLRNIEAKAMGRPATLEAYGFWKDHQELKSAQRAAVNNSRASMNCQPNGFGGLRCN
ncbi:hypothetical protein [Polaromonas sp.]|uniref:hypothetical protein n=1 Tax=Polaromonas sp. TaxID=1869339 RepID=UPI003265776D